MARVDYKQILENLGRRFDKLSGPHRKEIVNIRQKAVAAVADGNPNKARQALDEYEKAIAKREPASETASTKS